ncbi:MAG: sigma-70 family RNA polymerase sigma factor [Phycisphaerales bacterium]|nr:MAG: sigma-70 family RNA polymerase sigma factor [Phycisphaerales bacterium]
MLEDKLLVWKFSRGDKDALRRIYEKYKDDLVTLAAALLIDLSTAEDAVHDVFAAFINSAEGFRLTGSLKGYLATCVANNARNRNRTRQRHPDVPLDEAAAPATESTGPDTTAIFGEELRRLTWALGELPYEQREVLILRTYGGMRFKAIAGEQRVSINTVQGRYRYALEKLRSMLDGEAENETRR